MNESHRCHKIQPNFQGSQTTRKCSKARANLSEVHDRGPTTCKKLGKFVERNMHVNAMVHCMMEHYTFVTNTNDIPITQKQAVESYVWKCLDIYMQYFTTEVWALWCIGKFFHREQRSSSKNKSYMGWEVIHST